MPTLTQGKIRQMHDAAQASDTRQTVALTTLCKQAES